MRLRNLRTRFPKTALIQKPLQHLRAGDFFWYARPLAPNEVEVVTDTEILILPADICHLAAPQDQAPKPKADAWDALLANIPAA
jgi:hypothetical protein